MLLKAGRVANADVYHFRHLSLLLCLFRYSFSWISFNWHSRWGQFTYRTAFISAALTYGIVVYKTWRARQKVGAKYPGGFIGLLSDENVQYLGMFFVSFISFSLISDQRN